MKYEPTATGYLCKPHATEFRRGDECGGCAAERRNATKKIESVSTAGAESLEIDDEIRKLADDDLSFAKYLHRISKDRIEDGNPNDWSAAAKLIAEGTRLKRFAVDIKDRISARSHSRYLVEHEKALKGLTRGKGN